MPIQYLNTDLDLVANDDLSPLAAALEARGIRTLHVRRADDGLSYATFETYDQFEEPELTIITLLGAIESLDDAGRKAWFACSQREFNIGYDCGDDPWAFNNGLSTETLRRMIAVAASLRITIYPERPACSAGPVVDPDRVAGMGPPPTQSGEESEQDQE